MSKFEIKELLVSDLFNYRAIRLKSLNESPESFGSTYKREVDFSPDQWKSRLSTSPSNRDVLALAVISNGAFIGLSLGVKHESNSDEARIYQMWVAPQYRGIGVGSALIDRVKKWAVDVNSRKILLSLTTSNMQAVSLYLTMGFKLFGAREPLREGTDLQVQPIEFTLHTRDA
jgi:ribosomal protein S18 acetylase RimI-like enzyme